MVEHACARPLRPSLNSINSPALNSNGKPAGASVEYEQLTLLSMHAADTVAALLAFETCSKNGTWH